jgi:hypothetical protein
MFSFLSQGLPSQTAYSRCEVLVFHLDFCVVHYRPFLFMDAFFNFPCILITGQPTELQNVATPPSVSSHPKAPSSRFLFTDHEVELLTRNGEEILQLHEHFVKELCMVLEPLGFSRESDESESPRASRAERLQLANVDEAIRIVSTKFSTEVVFHLLWFLQLLLLSYILGVSVQYLPNLLCRPPRGYGRPSQSCPSLSSRARHIRAPVFIHRF